MRLFILYILIFLYTSSFGSLTFKVDSTNYLIGDQAIFTLEFQGPSNIEWHHLQDTLTKDLEIVELSKIDTISEGHYKQLIHLTAWDTGYYVVPPIYIDNSQSAPSLLKFNTVQINPSGDIKAIKPQMDTPFIFAEIKTLVIWASIILVLFIGLIILAIYLYRRNKNKPQEEYIPPPRPVMEVLWERFNELSESKIWEKGEQKAFQTELSLILRTFLEFKYNIKALEETTLNITNQLNAIGTDRVFKDEVTHILNFSDMVKFAKQKGIYAQHENALGILKKFLESQIEKQD